MNEHVSMNAPLVLACLDEQVRARQQGEQPHVVTTTRADAKFAAERHGFKLTDETMEFRVFGVTVRILDNP